MSQQINLYSPIFRRQKKHFSARAMVISAAIVAGALAVLYGYARHQAAAISRQAAQVESERGKVLAQMVEYSKRDDSAEKRKAIESAIKLAEAKLAARERLASSIPDAAPGGQVFSGVLSALARRTVEGVWLLRIEVSAADATIALSGRTRSADLIPAYLARLREEPALAGHTFGKLQIATPAAAARPGEAKPREAALSLVEFTLGAPAERAAADDREAK